MKILLLIPVVLLPVLAQIQRPSEPPPAQVAAKPAGGTVGTNRPAVPLEAISVLEKKLDQRIADAARTDPCVSVAGNRGVYVNGFGVLFTSDVDLVNSPATSPFNPTIQPEVKAQVHKRKLAHVSMLQQSMSNMVLEVAADPSLKGMAETDQIVVVVRLVYRPWEDLSGLPAQMVVRADRHGSNLRTELQ